MIVGRDYVFVSVPKCGTHTMYHVLEKYFRGRHLEPPYHRRRLRQRDEEKFRFTVVRNPYARMVSVWSFMTKFADQEYREEWIGAAKGTSLLAFMHLLLTGNIDGLTGAFAVLPMHKYLAGIKFDRVIKLEQLETDFAKLPFVRGSYKIPHLLKRVDDWKKHVTLEIACLIRQWVGPDFRRFGYDEPGTTEDGSGGTGEEDRPDSDTPASGGDQPEGGS